VQDDANLKHYSQCADADIFRVIDLDFTDERWLAETAAAKDIDTALACLRNIRRQLPKVSKR
jgi:hypothetical protein